MAKVWTLKEDYTVCKFVDEHDVFISAQDLNGLVMKLKDLGFDRSKEAVNKRVYDYQHLLTGQEAKYATDQERTVAEGFLGDSQIHKAYNWIEKYVEELYRPNEEADIVDYSMGENACDKSQYLPIQAVEVKDKFGWVLDNLLEKYYLKHKTGKKTLGTVKKEFKNDLATVYGVSLDTFNAIHRDKYQSISKKILFKLCFALELEYEEAKMLLESAGLDFKRSNKFELVIEAILKCDSHRRFIICEIDETLERNGCEPLFY